MKILNIFFLIFVLNFIDTHPLLSTHNRNIIWTSNSCWIDSGLQCMTTFQYFNEALQQQALQESSLAYKLRFMLNELKKTSVDPVNVSDFYTSAVNHGIGAQGTGGGDFVPSVLFYLLNNDLPELKFFFRIIEQNKRGEKIIENEIVKNARLQKSEITQKLKVPEHLRFPKTDDEIREKKLLIAQREALIAPFDKIINENTKKVPLYEYRVSYHTTIGNFDKIANKPDDQLTKIIAPRHLLLQLPSINNLMNIPLKIFPYFSHYSYALQAKGLTTAGHATCIVHDGQNNWYFYDDLGRSIELVNPNDIEKLQYRGKNSDFLYYNRTDEYSINTEDTLALSCAARDGNKKLVEIILKARPDNVNEKNEDLFSPLHWAVLGEQLDIVKMLVSSGAHINAKTISNETPLHFAALVGSTPITDFLIKNGAFIDPLNNFNGTPLHYAVKEFNLRTTEMLLNYGAHVNAISEPTFHPLTQAIQNTSIQTKKISLQLIKLLLSFGADKNLLDNGGKNAYDRCNLMGNDILKNEVKTLLDTITQTRHASHPQVQTKQLELTSRLTSLKSSLQELKKKLLGLRKKLKSLAQKITHY